MTVYVAGNCIAPGLVECLSLMCPSERFVRLRAQADAAAVAGPDDLIFWQKNPAFPHAPGGRGYGEQFYPVVEFTAYHPDLAYVHGPGGLLGTPMSDYHSSLAFSGWRRGLSIAQTLALYRADVYAALGWFPAWNAAARPLRFLGDAFGFPLEAMALRWRSRGCFMHSANHPKLAVVADIARELARRARLPVSFERPEDALHDRLLDGPVWPVYPEIGAHLGVDGTYVFKLPRKDSALPAFLNLEEFVTASFAAYDRAGAGNLRCAWFNERAESALDAFLDRAPAGPRTGALSAGPSPYASLPDERWWKRAVANVAPAAVDPAAAAAFAIDRTTRIATAGSCFAQHVSQALVRRGYSLLVTEPDPAGTVFSARYGNVYTARQLLQLFDRAFGAFVPCDTAWRRPDGRFADPFRPRAEPHGFPTVAALIESRDRHLAAVRRLFCELEVLVFTLGLTEAWESVADGAVYPLAPGVAGGAFDPLLHRFSNARFAAVTADLHAFLARLRDVNPGAHVVLTVSPVPLVVTYEPRHVLASTTVSKAVLRAACDEIEREHANVWYFPAYEVVTGAFNRGAYVGADARSVTPAGVDHVMRLFFTHVTGAPAIAQDDALYAPSAFSSIVCDEDALST